MNQLDLLKHFTDAVPSSNDMLAWIREVVHHGIRRPGSDAGHRVEDWVASRFRYLGLHDVRREPLPVPVWEPGAARLVAWPAGRPSETVELPGFPLPYTAATGPDGLEADVVALPPDHRTGGRDRGDAGPSADSNETDAEHGADAGADAGAPTLRGAIAVDVLRLTTLSPSYMRRVATRAHDPAGELDGYEHLLPFGRRLGREVERAVDASAAAYVGVLATMPWDTNRYYVPYDAVERPLPAVWVDRTAGARLLAMLEAGPVRGRIEVAARTRAGQTCNVVGTLPGASDEWVVIGSHHDAPWASAVEDGTGIALVLAQARFWSQVPEAKRPHNLLFLLNGAHMAGGAGILSFLDTHADLLDRVVLSLHLEHAAAACEARDGALVATGDPEVRWWFTSRDAALEDAVVAALAAEHLGRSWILPPDVFGDFPPTDGGGFHLHGVPLVDFLTAPVYLFDACDTLDKVHEPSLDAVTRAAVRIVASLAGRSAADLRAAVASASPGASPAAPPPAAAIPDARAG